MLALRQQRGSPLQKWSRLGVIASLHPPKRP